MDILDRVWSVDWLRGLIKYLTRMITGKSEIHRICTLNNYSDHSLHLVNLCVLSMERSKYTQLHEAVLCDDVDCINEYTDVVFFIKLYSKNVSDILYQKTIEQNFIFYDNLKYVIKHIYEYNTLQRIIQQKMDSVFDRDDPAHMAKLKTIWTYFGHKDDEFPIDKSEKWKYLGFQGLLPETDFRGMGILALDALEFFCQQSSCSTSSESLSPKCIFHESLNEPYGYPFAIGVINLLQSQVDLLIDGRLRNIIIVNYENRYEYQSMVESNINNFWMFFREFYYGFHRFWMSSKQQNILNFNILKKIYVDNCVKNFENL